MTRLAILDKFDNYFKAIDEIRDKQLRVLNEQHFRSSENKLNEIELWNNVLALVYIQHKYGMIKEVLELLSDSRNHIWLKYGKEKRENHYKSITDTILTDLDEEALTAKSLDKLWDKITKEDFQKQLRQIRWNLYFESYAFLLPQLLAGLIILGLSITGFVFGIMTLSLNLCVFSIYGGMGVAFICPLIATQFFSQNPFTFKHEIAKKFLTLDKKLKLEIENASDFSRSIWELTFQINLSKHEKNVSEQLLTIKPPFNFQPSKSRNNLNSILSNHKLITFTNQNQELSIMQEVDSKLKV